VDIPAILQLAREQEMPICGKDFKTGQTFLKTVLAPAFKARLLGLDGWFSANILGNRDGEVLDDPEAFRTKEESKLSVLEYILQPELYPDLYGHYDHRVRINYYRPAETTKRGGTISTSSAGWVSDADQGEFPLPGFHPGGADRPGPGAFLDLAQRSGMYGIQEWLSFYFKSPMAAPGSTRT